MNISTGGPHLLLFERDQQLATLLTSELQLAGYECHTARTAVEVFDAISRYPIRLVLVNLAQAAAARREFWVALDTQRRGRGVQVFTFQCTNIAGYGSRDLEERSQTVAVDMEVDGMLGLMSLVDAVRARVPGTGTVTNTMPRMPKASTPPPLTPQQHSASSTLAASNPTGVSGAAFRANMSSPEVRLHQTAAQNQAPLFPQQSNVNLNSTLSQSSQSLPTIPQSDLNNSLQPPSYSDRIRAVLYPNQRTWSSSSGNSTLPNQENQAPGQTTDVNQAASALQNLANGQFGTEVPQESGLAQLSRLLRDYRPATTNERPQESIQPTTHNGSMHYTLNTQQANQTTVSGTNFYTPPAQVPNNQPQTFQNGLHYSQAQSNQAQQVEQSPASSFAQPTSQPLGSVEIASETPINNTRPLRAAPIQDLPMERPTPGQLGLENLKRTDAVARNPYAQQTAASVLPLSSIINPQATNNSTIYTPETVSKQAEPVPQPEVSAETQRQNPEITQFYGTQNASAEQTGYPLKEQAQVRPEQETKENKPEEIITPSNATLIDIMESLPPMPPLSAEQSREAQQVVLNGRATRSLGSVLLAGHLVPENRLEVVQHVQRMLRGVDLNYQLGEILLMFKLLTPDQLLAASLVSYGLISTQQISALGRIRQDLHSIGLEYDLENLLVVFRMLTPEQIREAKTGWQG